MKLSNLFATLGVSAFLITAGCGGTDAAEAVADTGSSSAPAAAASSAAAPAAETADNIVEVTMVSGRGEIFEPADVTVNRGDVVRFVLVSGVHNASFPASKNLSGVKLPNATPYLSSPGQTHDMTIDMPAGVYHFQCDPHVALGMVGTITVVE